MARKLIYFVRHGQTENNAKEIRQGEEGGLSEKGRAQALATAKRFPKTKGCPQTIISSPYERAKETAAILSKELNVHIEYSPLLVERKNPTEIVGRPARDKQVKEIADMIDGSYHADEFQMSDEETFIDLKVRTRKLLDYIMDRPEERMIMVTHSRFLKMIVSYMLLGDELKSAKYNNLNYLNPINNGSMAICSYTTHFFKKNEWKLLVWNDLG